MLHICTFLYKVLKTKEPCYIFEMLQFRGDYHSLNLRKRNNLAIHRHRLQKYKCSFEYYAATLYNKYKHVFVTSSSLGVFKAGMFNVLLKCQ